MAPPGYVLNPPKTPAQRAREKAGTRHPVGKKGMTAAQIVAGATAHVHRPAGKRGMTPAVIAKGAQPKKNPSANLLGKPQPKLNLTKVVHKAVSNNKPSAKPKGNKGGKGGGKGQSIGIPTGNVGVPIPENLAGQGEQLYNPQYATTQAAAEFDPQIAVVKDQQRTQVANAAQALHDIQHWYSQVQGSEATAAARDKASGATASGNIGHIASGILSSLGGAANPSAGMVAAEGQNQQGTAALLNTAQEQYHNDVAPLLQAEQAGASSSENARQSQVAHDLANQMLTTVAAKGAKRSELLMNLQQMNNTILGHRLDTLLNIKQGNNALKQQNFSNRLSASEAQVAAHLTNAQIKAYATGSSGNGFTSWSKANPSQRQDLIAGATGSSLDQYGGLMGNPTDAWNTARQYLVGQGYTSAAKGVKNKAHTSMGNLIDAALKHAIAVNQQRAAAAKAAAGQ